MTDYCITSRPVEYSARWHGFALGIIRKIEALATMPGHWRQRAADLRHLRTLDDHVLADMGLTRTEVEREAYLPFWRPLLMVSRSRQDCNAASDPRQV